MNRSDSPNWLKDGSLAFHGGVDGSVPPSDIARNQVAQAVNCSMRRGPIKPRPGWKKRTLTYESTATETALQGTNYQHIAFYYSERSPSLIAVHGGRLFKVDLLRLTVQEITPLLSDGVTRDRNNALKDIGWSEQMGAYWVYQDNQALPIIFNGAGCRRSNPAANEIPVGNVMTYAQGRLAVALPDRQTYRVGDILFSPVSGTAALNYKDSVLRFTENNYLSEGGDFVARVFGAPSAYGPITAMKAIAQLDTTLGQGPLMIGQPYNFFTVQLPFDRTIWKDMTNPQQTNVPVLGPMSQDSMVLVNGDIWYRGLDGIRSFVMAIKQFSSWTNSAQSAEIEEMLANDTPWLLEHGSAVLFDNRYLCTISPAPSIYGVWHRGLAVIDFQPVSGMNKAKTPAWAGIWTGLRVLKILKGMVGGKERCYIWALTDEGDFELWELDPTAKFDGDDDTPISWSFETPSYNCGNSDEFKLLQTSRIIVTNLTGRLEGTVKYRTDQNPCFTPWDSISVCAKFRDCATPECDGPHTYSPQQRTPIRLKMPPDVFDPITNENLRTGFEHQMRFDLEGYGEIRQIRIYTQRMPEMLGIKDTNQV